jgi:energy-converting hydrogenase Eha subunit G
MPFESLFESAAAGTNLPENILPGLVASLVVLLVFVYVRGILRAYRAAGADWAKMDRDVKMVFLLAVPLFRGAIKVLVLADQVFYTPKVEAMTRGISVTPGNRERG